MKMAKLFLFAGVFAFGIGFLFPGTTLAQGEGPKTYQPAPDGTNVFVTTYMNLSTNMNFNQSAALRDADIDINLVVPTYKRFFDIKGRMAEFVFSAITGTLSGSVGVGNARVNIPRKTGFFDPYVGLRVALYGSPALKLPEFIKHKQGLQVYGIVGTYIPIGKYDSASPVNLGTNRWTIRTGAAFVKPFGKPTRPVALEVVPTVSFFTANNDPFGPTVKSTQKPLLQVENHLSYNLTKKVWASLDARYQAGGETSSDGVEQDNALNQLGGGFTVGVQATQKLSFQAGYGSVWFKGGNDDSKSNMIRIRGVYVF